MKKLLPLLLLLYPLSAGARQRAQGDCTKGAVTLTVSGLGTITQQVQGSFPSCSVRVFQTATTNLATLFADNAGTALSNPFTADSNGHYFFYLDNGRYDVQISGGGLASPITFGDIQVNDPTAQYIDVTQSPYDADSTGVLDASTPIINAFAAAKGTWAGTSPFVNSCKSVYFPPGTYKVVSNFAIRLLQGHSGCGMYGAGPYASVINYTNTTTLVGTNYLICHDETVGAGNFCGNTLGDGKLQRFFIRDMGFTGPGSASVANWFYDQGTSGTGGMYWENVMLNGFVTNFNVQGTAGTDTGKFIALHVRDAQTVFELNNLQSVPYDLIDPDICTGSGAGAKVFDFNTNAATGWQIYGGYLCTQSATGIIFNYAASYGGGVTNVNTSIHGTHLELLGGGASTSQLITDNTAGSGARKELAFFNANSDVVQGVTPRSTVTLSTKSKVSWYGGVFGGLITLNSINGAGGNQNYPPEFTLMDAVYDAADGLNHEPTEQTCNPGCVAIAASSPDRPIFKRINVEVSGLGKVKDEWTGPSAILNLMTNGMTLSPETAGNTTLSIDRMTITGTPGAGGLTLNGDAAFTSSPEVWTTVKCGVYTGPTICSFNAFAKPITVLRVTLQLSGAPTGGCSPFPVYTLGLGNGGAPYSGGNVVQSFTTALATLFYDSGAVSVNVASGQINVALNNTPAGCGGREADPVMSVLYRMQ